MDSILENFLIGFAEVSQLSVLMCLFTGSLLGIVIGAIPGLGPAVAIAVLLPATFSMEPLAGLSLLLGIYCASWYSGAIPAILINTPGTPVAVLTTYDGYPMTRNGQAKRALSIAFTSSFVGGLISVVVLALSATLLAQVAKNFGAVEFAAATLLGMVLIIVAHRGQMYAASMMLGIGLFTSCIGLDSGTGSPRFTFGSTELLSGIPLVPVVLGIFAIAQALVLIETGLATHNKTSSPEEHNSDKGGIDWKAIREVFRYPVTLIRSSAFGVGIGVLPGVGEFLAQFLSYISARKFSKQPETFGKGNPEGLISSESANNAVTGAALVPLLALGIPGEALTAMMMNVFMVHNVIPGPRLFSQSPELIQGIYVSLLMMNFFIFAVLLSLSRWAKFVTRVRPTSLGVAILALSLIGTYSLNYELSNVWIALVFGIFGYFGRRLGLPLVPVILGMVLGPILETRLRQTLTLGDGSFMLFLERPIAAGLIIVMLLLIFSVFVSLLIKPKKMTDHSSIHDKHNQVKTEAKLG